EPTQEGAADDARGDRRAATPGRRRDQAAHRGAAEPADRRLLVPVARFAAREYQDRQRDHRGRLQRVFTPEHPLLHRDSSLSARVTEVRGSFELRTIPGEGPLDFQYHGAQGPASRGGPFTLG